MLLIVIVVSIRYISVFVQSVLDVRVFVCVCHFSSVESSSERTELRVTHLRKCNRQVKSAHTGYFLIKTSVLNNNDRDLNGERKKNQMSRE